MFRWECTVISWLAVSRVADKTAPWPALIIKLMTPRNTEDGDASGAGGLIGTKLYTAAGTYERLSHRHCEISRTRVGVLRGATASRYGVRGTAPVYSARVLLSWQQAASRMLTTVRNSGVTVGQART